MFGLASFVSVLTLSAVVAGTVSGYTIFYRFGLSYADYATPSDAIILALRSPLALGFWMAVGAYAAMVIWMTMISRKVLEQVIGFVLIALVLPMTAVSSWAVSTAAIETALRKDSEGFWQGYFLGIMPLVDIQAEPEAIPAQFRSAKRIRQITSTSGYILLTFDDTRLVLRKDLVRSLHPVAALN
ncbi:hypothetical protein [Paracoccus shandongensis]|uniref:hypothetical protein n=1 Tax=Paracoccus shandongensis TaxID=2816048 RepID=UPI001A90B282|nr:hypothetical protein [Paracoccus shandongensis]